MDCPGCSKGKIIHGVCNSCGVTQRINEETGNVVYFRGNKLIAMPQDKADRVKMMKDKHS
tara:strand:- start:172 stop:351 length:180 start_codon:yes stop_codon:yes gene_type:complete